MSNIAEDRRARLRERMENGKFRPHPLTFPQRELWEASPVPVGDMANHICCVIEVRGKATAEDCSAALAQVVGRQEALRVSFLPGKDRPLQMIRENCPVNFRAQDVSGEAYTALAIEEIAQGIFGEPFDLLQGPLYRVVLLSRSADDHLLVFAIHHAIADGWTLGVFLQELCVAYIQRVRGLSEPIPEVALSYTGWGAVERAYWQGAELESRAVFWKSYLGGHRRIWADREGADTASGAHQRVVTYFSAEILEGARELARRGGATLFSTLLGAFQIALAEWTGAKDIVVGTPVANRTKQASKETMGYFAGIVPIRWEVDPEAKFGDSLRALHQNTLECFAQAMPFVELARALGDLGSPGHNPIFEVRFALQNHPIPDVVLPGISAKLRMRSTGTARYLLGCEITEEGDRLEVVWLFRAKLFSQVEVDSLRRLFQSVLVRACGFPETKISNLMKEP